MSGRLIVEEIPTRQLEDGGQGGGVALIIEKKCKGAGS